MVTEVVTEAASEILLNAIRDGEVSYLKIVGPRVTLVCLLYQLCSKAWRK